MLSRSSAAGQRPATPGSEKAGRRGLTLLEVLISTAIFLLALLGIAQLIGLGSDLAVDTQFRTEGLQLAQSKLSQVVMGIIPLNGNTGGDINPTETPNQQKGWTWSLDCSQADVPNLWNVRVTVERPRPGGVMRVTLTQLVLDPSVRGTNQQPSNSSSSGSSGASQ
jgi:general secretion pathway protein I